ncbi:MAG: NigD-like protein [Mediterranea sp.]|nr:NigD-like protein [Mediterranea sp.]
MRKLNVKAFLGIVAILLGTAGLTQSCLKEEKPDLLALATINKVATVRTDKGYYFTTDGGETLFPAGGTGWATEEYTDGQRAFVLFNNMDTPAEGYDYNVDVKQVTPVLTKEVVTLGEGENTEEKVGDDKINATYLWISKDRKYLTIEFQYYGTDNADKKHLLNLVVNPATTGETGSGEFADLEFRHNDEGDEPVRLGEGYVSFKLDKIKSLLEGKKGVKVRVNTLYDGIKQYEISFSTD